MRQMIGFKRLAVESEGRANHSSLREDANSSGKQSGGLCNNSPYDWYGLLKLSISIIERVSMRLRVAQCVYSHISCFL